MSVRPRPRLPPAEGFSESLKRYQDNLVGAEGSFWSRKLPGIPHDCGKFPPKFNLKIRFYDVAEKPWKSIPPPTNPNLHESSLLQIKAISTMSFSLDQLLNWEGQLRNLVSVTSYIDCFLVAATELAK